MTETTSIEIIKSELIKSCVNYDTKSFILFLLSKNVLTGMPNKIRFYRFYKQMVNCTKISSNGQLTVKVENEKTKNNSKNYYLNFYDRTHKHSRLSIEVREIEKNIYFDTLPF